MGEIPEYLRQYVAKQEYDQYSAIDHAGWRYIMRVSRQFFREHAHPKYLEGLKATGITIDRIPKISEMDEKLRKFGWRAVPVTGFIPPAVFLEFLSLGVLPIACDMRRLEHLEYTPSPDIVHEAAGHAPILADRGFATYLLKFGEIARKVIFAKEDIDVYEAVLHLSEIKEDTRTKPEEIEAAYQRLEEAQKKVTYTSEASQLSRLGWWSTEYGLVHNGERFLIYGAGLLSSVGESYNCFSDEVKKIPLTIDCINVNYDITKPQPQLFHVNDFKELEKVIDELAATMAYKTGGVSALEKAKKARTVTTTELGSGLQISGVLVDFRTDEKGEVAFLKYAGPSQLALADKELPGQGPAYHKHGFSSPVGKIAELDRDAATLTLHDLEGMGFRGNNKGELRFASGIKVSGRLSEMCRRDGRTLIITFTDCTVNYGDEILFQPDWGPFDMACGSQVVSVFGGAADRANYLRETGHEGPPARKQLSNVTEDNVNLIPLYSDIRRIRESGEPGAGELSRLERIAAELTQSHPQEWLLRLEILEILETYGLLTPLQVNLRAELSRIAAGNSTRAELIRRGLDVLAHARGSHDRGP